MTKITLAASAGFCFGVKRAVEQTEALLDQNKPVSLLGELIHNKQMTDQLLKRGAIIVETPAKCRPGDTLVIRAHGVAREVMAEIERLGLTVCDLTCPFVRKIHTIVDENSNEHRPAIIIGDPNHPEVVGIRSFARGPVYVIESPKALEALLQAVPMEPLVVAQTTFLAEDWKKSVKILKKYCTNAKIYDTICYATQVRQEEARNLAKYCDAMIVLGDRLSSNTRKLLLVCEAHCSSYLIEGASELHKLKHELEHARHIGCTAGASTPARIIKEALNTMSELTEGIIQEEFLNGDDDFSAALEASLQSMSTDQKVKGIVTAVNQSEIQVDIGRKQTGYVAASEYSNDPNADPTQEVKIGDELDLIILKTNDAEGTVQLSKKKFDSVAAWGNIVAAEESGEVLEGKVIDVIKGGVLVLTSGMRVFIPGSLTGLPRNEALDVLAGQTVQFRVIEINKQRRRAVGSIRAVTQETRREAEKVFWESAEVGKVIQGTVKSIVSYGAFVDIGGLDGMVHISELSWSRIKDPTEVLNVGDNVEVYIKALDEEKRKISLGYRKAEDNPWEVMRIKHPVDSVVDCTIVSFTSFGAFARVIPGVDGLIHISQIANRRVEKPQDELEIGQTVQAMVVGLDLERRRVSLSMRALLPEEPYYADEPEEDNGEDTVVASFGSDVETVIADSIADAEPEEV